MNAKLIDATQVLPWRNDADLNSRFEARILKAAAHNHRKHGEDPGTLDQAAAHEAGHAVVYGSIGYRIDRVKVHRLRLPNRVVWAGRTLWHNPHGLEFGTGLLSPAQILNAALGVVSGYAGESIAGVSHPSSSIDERVAAEYLCNELAKIGGIAPREARRMIWKSCLETIRMNQGVFDSIREHLVLNRRLNRPQARSLLANLKMSPSL